LFVAFTLLMLLLPSPFTQAIFSLLKEKGVIFYFTSSIAALAVLVFIVFRHRIVMNIPYQAMKTALEAMNDILIKTDLEFAIEMAQGGVLYLLGYSENELIGRNIGVIMQDDGRLAGFRQAVLNTKTGATSFEVEVLSKSGDHLQMDFSFTPIFANEEVRGFVGVGRNITEKKRLEAQLRQAQKMEILGTLAGGVAHDFNNLLTIILVNTQMVERYKVEPDKLLRSLDSVKSAVQRAAGITSQLLTFARKSEVSFASADINKGVAEVAMMLVSTFHTSITVSLSLAEGLPRIRAD